MDEVKNMYVVLEMSIPEISKSTGISQSTIRFRLLKEGVLRNRTESIRLAAKHGKLGSGNRGKTRVLTADWKANISKGKLKNADETAKGVSLKPNGYMEYTRGEHKGRSVHVVTMEKYIGRRLFAFECVHHKDEDKQNNELENLQLMTRAEHARLHAIENLINRTRSNNGQFE